MENTVCEPSQCQLPQEKTRHDCLASTSIVPEEESDNWHLEHVHVNGFELVWEWIDP